MRANIPKGMGGGAQNMQAMLRQAQKMQEEMEALQADLDEREYDVSAGGGVVNVKINGKKEILSIGIEPEIVDPDDIETLSDILVAAVNEAIKRVYSEFFGENRYIGKPLQFVGRNTLDIYLLHYFVLLNMPIVLRPYIADTSNIFTPLVVGLTVAVLVVAISLLISRIIRLSDHLAYYLLGARNITNIKSRWNHRFFNNSSSSRFFTTNI